MAPPLRYPLPDWPIAVAAADIGHVTVDLALTLRGEVEVAAHDPAVAGRALGRIGEGVFVSGLGTEAPTVGCTSRHRFTQTTTSFLAPATMRFSGPGVISYEHEAVRVRGEVRYTLAVTVTPRDVEPEAHRDAASWFTRNGGTLAAIGAVVLVAQYR